MRDSVPEVDTVPTDAIDYVFRDLSVLYWPCRYSSIVNTVPKTAVARPRRHSAVMHHISDAINILIWTVYIDKRSVNTGGTRNVVQVVANYQDVVAIDKDARIRTSRDVK